MFIYTAKFSKSRTVLSLLFLLIAVVGILCAVSLPGNNSSDDICAGDDTERCAYLRSLGWEVEELPIEVLTLTLPEPLEEPYLSYNALQLEQGFDLTPYAGKSVERCVYTVTNHPSGKDCRANLYVCGGRLIGGDILAAGEGGFIAPLAFPEE